MQGKYDGAQDITLLKEGGVGKKAWKLWGTDLIVDGQSYGLTGFSKQEIQDKLDKLKPGMLIAFETEERGNFTNVKPKTEITIVATASANYMPLAKPAPPAMPKPKKLQPTIPFMKDEDIFKLMDDCIKAVHKSLKDQDIAFASLDETTTMINSVFMACREERKAERRWE